MITGNKFKDDSILQTSHKECKREISRTLILRCLVAFFLACAAVITAVYSFYSLSDSETNLAEKQFYAIASQAVEGTRSALQKSSYGGQLFAAQYSRAFPHASQWPNATLEGFQKIHDLQTLVSATNALFFGPLVWPEQVPAFEAYAYEYFKRDPFVSDDAGISSFGKGIYSFSPNSTQPDKKIHDTTGIATLFDSPYAYMSPVLQMNRMDDPALSPGVMFNARYQPYNGQTHDAILTCSLVRNASQDIDQECGAFTDIVGKVSLSTSNPNAQPQLTDADSIIILPIYPFHDPFTLVGFAGIVVALGDLLKGAVHNYVDGVDCVFSTSTTVFTYRFLKGQPVLQGVGDKHDPDYSSYAISADLLTELSSTVSQVITGYKVTFYPRREFFEYYETDAPRNTSISVAILMISCLFIFFLYTRSVRADSDAKDVILETKRRFVRFISHEVRTPLNTIRLGLSVLETDMVQLNQILAQEIIDEDKGEEDGLLCMRPPLTPGGSPVDMHDSNLHDRSLQLLNPNNQYHDPVTTRQGIISNQIVMALRSWSCLISEVVDDIRKSSDNAVTILDDLLNYDKIEMGTLRLEYSAVLIWKLIGTTTNVFAAAAVQEGVDLELKGDYWEDNGLPASAAKIQMFDRLRVVGDEYRLQQVLRNLISNALKFTPKGGKVSVIATYVSDKDTSILASSTVDVTCTSSSEKDRLSQPADHHPGYFSNNIDEKANEDCEAPGTPRLQIPPVSLSPPKICSSVNRGPSSAASKYLASYPKFVQQALVEHPFRGVLRIDVKDDGTGLTEEQSTHLFQEGVQFNANELQAGQGSGLGLFISKGLVEQHGGTLRVHSEGLGMGATFQVELPVFEFSLADEEQSMIHGTGAMANELANKFQRKRDLYSAKRPVTTPTWSISCDSGGSTPAMINSAAMTLSRDGAQFFRQRATSNTTSSHPSSPRSNGTNIKNNDVALLSRANSSSSSIHKGDSTNREQSYGCDLSSTYVDNCNSSELDASRILDDAMNNVATISTTKATIPTELPPLPRSGREGVLSIKKVPHCPSTFFHHIMVVDDVASCRKMLIRLLKKTGYHTITEAKDGQEAIELYTSSLTTTGAEGSEGDQYRSAIDCILMDFTMPVMDGPTATKQLREMGCTCCIVGVTGNVLPEEFDYYISMGANYVMPKPLKWDKLQEVWESYHAASSGASAFTALSSVASTTVNTFVFATEYNC